eukprot:TRINITY_DN767_c0_g1_i5.p1 TRINITY_DN767_c0_g1~~TRINITY_DN767_c0_g1_i5.p1  ORF type:complete len:223 (+),score=27.94 TRINITY_DN767_c0_g1_i5:109-777(+)
MSSLSCHHALSNMFVPVPTSHCRYSKVSRIPVPRSGKLQGLIVRCQAQSRKASNRRASKVPERKEVKKKQYHLWKGKGNCRSGQKARAVVDIVLKLPSTKEAVCGALDQWVAWEEEFPSIAVAKALRILKKRSQWLQLIQVAKWMLSKGQGMTMGTYEVLILALDSCGRINEAEALWEMVCQKYCCSIPRVLFARVICMYERHNRPEKVIEILATRRLVYIT